MLLKLGQCDLILKTIFDLILQNLAACVPAIKQYPNFKIKRFGDLDLHLSYFMCINLNWPGVEFGSYSPETFE